MNAKTTSIAAAVLIVLLGGAFLMLSGPSREPDDDTFALETGNGDKPTIEVDAPGGSAPVAPVETSAYTGQEEWDLDKEPAATEDNLRFALVVDRDGKPVPGVEVALVPTARGGGRGWPGSESRSPTAYRKVKSGKDGFALLSPLPARRFRIEAIADGLFGAADFDQSDEPDAEDEDLPAGADALITLEPIKRILVRVQDPTGDPVPALQVHAMMDMNNLGPPVIENGASTGAEIVFGGMDPSRGGRGNRRGNRGFRMGFLSEWTRDPDGVAVLEVRNDSGLYDMTQVSVSAVLPGAEAVSRVVDLLAEGTTEVTLQVPHTISLTVKLTTEEEEPFTGNASLQWNLVSADGNAPNRRGGMNFLTNPSWGSQRVTDGVVTLAGFQPGAKVNFTTNASQRTSATKEVILATDLRQEVSVPVGDLVPRLTFALVDASGQPLSNTEVRVRVDWDDEAAPAAAGSPGAMSIGMARAFRARTMTTDAKGQIQMDGRTRTAGILKVHSSNMFAGGNFRTANIGTRNRGGFNDASAFEEPTPLAGAAVAALAGGEQRDLGTLAIDESQILLAGTVVNHEGKPLGDAEVSITTSRKPESATPERTRGMEFGGFPGGSTVRSDKSGRFLVFGVADPDFLYSASANTREAKSKRVHFDPGFRGLVLATQLTGGLRGRITKHTPEIATPIAASLLFSGPNALNARTDLRLRPDGSFVARGLEAGLYSLQISIGGHVDTTIPGIEIRGGEITEPSVLTHLVVGQSMIVARVMVTNSAGMPAPGIRVEFNQTMTSDAGQNGPGRRRRTATARTNERGEATTLLPADVTVAVQIRDQMHLPVDVPNATFPLFVRLTDSPKLTLTFPALPEIESVRRYLISLSPQEQPAEASPGGAVPSGRRGGPQRRNRNEVSLRPGTTSTTFTNVAEGKYTIEVYVEASGRVGPGATALAIEGPGNGFFRVSGGRLGPIPVGDLTWANKTDQTINLNPDLLSAARALLDESR